MLLDFDSEWLLISPCFAETGGIAGSTQARVAATCAFVGEQRTLQSFVTGRKRERSRS
jgi:hypothetical protein